MATDESYEIEDSHLQNARKFYKSCAFTRDSKTTKLAYQSLLRDLFGGWKLIPSISTDREVTDLTDLFLSIISHTGSSQLFSLNIEEKIFAINKIPIPKGIHLSELNGIISIEELQLICPQINWDYLFEKLLQETGYEKYKQLSIIIEKRYQLKYRCEQYGDIMRRGDKGTLRTMIIMEFLIQQVLHALKFYTNGTNSNSNSSSQPHFDELCISQLKNAFPWTLERHYIRSHVNETHKTEVINMFNEIKVTVIDLLSKIDWLNEKDKAFMQDKISKLSIFALYSDQKTSQEKENLSTVLQIILFYVNRSPLESPIFITRAYYNGHENRIYVNAGIFQFPIYYENASLASKYGALGWVISHEIMHAIGIKGVLVDASGTSLSGLSGLILSAEIETKTSCFSNQYRFYKFTNYKVSLLNFK
ncbi:Nep2 peptidase (M13 family) [Schistosoma mansoni]|uniref:Nep2 peptidase (M13 family) n=1 Tax=Schistosoma mansoni TaxID=6183 RepID=UPI00022DC760|nr:Nep2 peptidase (M13 family) [Schistosoma mansoni]|eukprot:XP_018650347.1 Nep2 peptidase (M13 family) [Schistosoma mansoni]